VTQEQKRGFEAYERHFTISKDVFAFSIRPVGERERMMLNQYILESFLQERLPFKQEVYDGINLAADPVSYLQNKISELEQILNEVKEILADYKEPGMRLRFLSIFYKGFISYRTGGGKMIKVKRKFIEFFLYSQGLLFADYLNLLKMELQQRVEPEKKETHNLESKVRLLHQLGIIRFLEKRLKGEDNASGKEQLAALLCEISSISTDHVPLIIQQLASIGV
jgi:hypothetical protein